MNEEYFKEIIHSYLSNQASEKEIEDLTGWINGSDENKKQFFECRRAWILTSQALPRGLFNKAKYEEWKKLSEKLPGEIRTMPAIIISPVQKFIRIAAIFLLLVSIGSLSAWRITTKHLHNFVNRDIVHQISVPKGSNSEVVLPDGTKVSLNAGSTLSYKGSYGLTDRSVNLIGEGYFDVVTDPEVPFIVEAQGLRIKALGTKFNVKAYPEEKAIITTLVEGIVLIEGKGVNLRLTPSQKATYVKSGETQLSQGVEEKPEGRIKTSIPGEQIKPSEAPKVKLASNVDVMELTAWKDGRLVFNSEKLSTLSVLLERKFNVSININSEELLNNRFTGTFHKETLEQILDIINLSAPIKYQIEKGIVLIKIDEKRRAIYKEVTN